ncbi:hypothetical protein FOL47_001255 [Perkinsus chesapeaki]|uniref:Decapping nuclease n=1 Tax=Perkinsus chesapeaki TaxID=330153 RepID=A0A7J6MJZ6_PERCH|nr:hypothetical protein FOL47_001255 [Perkinsus chesapeaki]
MTATGVPGLSPFAARRQRRAPSLQVDCSSQAASYRKPYRYSPSADRPSPRSRGLPDRFVWHSDSSPSDRANRYSSCSGRGDTSPLEPGPLDFSPTGKRLNLDRSATYIGVLDRDQILDGVRGEADKTGWGITAIGSYSCHCDSTASDTFMVVPGVPPLYSPPKDPQEVQLKKHLGPPEDVLLHYDLAYPLRAAQRVVDQCTPGLDWSKVDLVTDRGTLCELLRFLGAITSTNQKSKAFEFPLNGGLHDEPATVECSYRHHTRYKEYKASFDMTTTTVPEGSERLYRHHRFSLLKIGKLNVVVRAEVDGLVKELEAEAAAYVDEDGWEASDEGRCTLWTQEVGVFNPEDATVELKCRAMKCPRAGFKAAYYEMALGCSDKLAVGRHQEGRLARIEEFSLAEVKEKTLDDVDKRWAELGRLLEELLILSYGRLSTVVWNGKSNKLIVKTRRNEWA